MKHWLTMVMVVGVLVSCAGRQEVLRVKQYHLRDLKVSYGDDPMARGEKLRRLHGAISIKEQEARRGDYYTALWHDQSKDAGPVEIVFEYQQGATASLVKRMVKKFPAGDVSGTAEFAVIGDDFQRGGRVLAWKTSLVRGGRVVASRHSYLCQ